MNPRVDFLLGLAIGVEASTAFMIARTKLDVQLSISALVVSGLSCGKAFFSSFIKIVPLVRCYCRRSSGLESSTSVMIFVTTSK